MNFPSFRTITAIALAALLTACGAGQQDTQGAMHMASSMQSVPAVATAAEVTSAATGTAAFAPAPGGAPTGAAVAAAAGPNNPAPD